MKWLAKNQGGEVTLSSGPANTFPGMDDPAQLQVYWLEASIIKVINDGI